MIRIRRVHLEEDTGKLTHIASEDGGSYAGRSEPGGCSAAGDCHRARYALSRRGARLCDGAALLLRYLGVNSGDMQKGVMRIEPNVSVRPVGSQVLGTRTEIKNLNSFRALERSVAYEIERQSKVLAARRRRSSRKRLAGTRARGLRSRSAVKRRLTITVISRSLICRLWCSIPAWIEEIRAALPELPAAKLHRFQQQYGLNAYDAGVLTVEPGSATYFEQVVSAVPEAKPKVVANWISGDLFSLFNQAGINHRRRPSASQAPWRGWSAW